MQGAVKIVQGTMGSENAKIIVLFVHTLDTARDLNEVLEKNGSKCGEDGLKVNMMAELPSYVFLAGEFLGYFTGLTIGSGDLTQPTLGLGRDSGLAAHDFVERNPAIMKGLETMLKAARAKGQYFEICKDHPDLARWRSGHRILSPSSRPGSS